jgi:hypothetical protein
MTVSSRDPAYHPSREPSGEGRIERVRVTSPGRQEVSRAHRTLVVVSMAFGGWLLVSAVIMPLPLTAAGRAMHLWTTGLALVIGVSAAARLAAPDRTRRSAIVMVMGGPALIAVARWTGAHPSGALAAAWWNLVGCGGALTLLSVAGLALLLRGPVPVYDVLVVVEDPPR